MTDSNVIDAATLRLALALEALQSAVDRKREADSGGVAVAMQIQALGNDRARLAADLDGTAAYARKLEGANREVSRRIDIAMGTIQTLLDEHDR